MLEEQRECGKSSGPGRPAKDPLLVLKMCVLQDLYGLSDEETALQCSTAQKQGSEDRAILARRKEVFENILTYRSKVRMHKTTRNWKSVTFLIRNLIGPQDLKLPPKKSA